MPSSILVLGDARDFAERVHRNLGQLGFHVVPAPADPSAAFLVATDHRPDALLVDIAAPLAFLDVASRVRRTFDIPVVHLTERADDDRVELASRTEPDGYVDDVGNPRALAGALDVALRRRPRRHLADFVGGPLDPEGDRLAGLGAIAAAMAHEINNPLTWVVGNLALVIDTLHTVRTSVVPQPNHPAMPRNLHRNLEGALNQLERACEGAERIRRIVADLRDFSAPDEMEQRPVDVRGVLDTALRVCGNEIKHRATIVRDYQPVPPVEANQTRLGQVFLNLLVNAVQAIPAGRAEANEIRVRVYPDRELDGWVAIEIEDTGSGIPAEYVERVFDPFFTTRPFGEGRGMGLSVAHGLVKDHGGRIAVRSKMGLGSTFTVKLPAAPVREATEDFSVDVDPSVEGRRGRVVVVDDEPLVLDVLSKLIGTLHEVETFTSGSEAIERVVANDPPVDAILCDLMMPDTTGMDVYEAVRAKRPDLADRIVFVTGGAFTDRAMRFLAEVRNPRLEKPFEVRKLFAVLMRVVSEAGPDRHDL